MRPDSSRMLLASCIEGFAPSASRVELVVTTGIINGRIRGCEVPDSICDELSGLKCFISTPASVLQTDMLEVSVDGDSSSAVCRLMTEVKACRAVQQGSAQRLSRSARGAGFGEGDAE
jgi:hypothetical protein